MLLPLNPVTLLSCLFLTFVVASAVTSESPNTLSADHAEEDIVRKWQDNFGKIKKIAAALIKAALPFFMSTLSSEELKISPGCQRAMFQWVSDLRSMKPWAVRMADASAKMVTGILSGTVSSFGAYDQCVDTVVSKLNLRGQYCTIEAWPSLPPKPRFYALNQRLKAFSRFENDTGMMGEFTKHLQLFYLFPFRIGICVPSACSASDVINFSKFVVKDSFPANVTVPRCEIKSEPFVEGYQVPMICLICVLAFLVFVGTTVDILLSRRKTKCAAANEIGTGTECILAFSAISNLKKLADVEAGADKLSVLHGIRFFSMCWIILGHTYFHLNFNILRHLQITIELTSQFIFNSVTNASLLVDNFFFLSGLLLIYVTMDMMRTIGKIPRFIYFIIHRFWRFLPIQMFFVGCTTLLPFFGDGPVWHENIDPIVEGCRRDWWANLIFINNFYRSTSKGCLSYSWYLSADFQIYIFCIPIIITIIRKPRIGLSINFAVMVLSVFAIAIHNYIRELPPTLLFTRADVEQREQLMMETYYTPFYHVGPFCLGIFVGYYLQVYKSPIKIHRVLRVAAWIVTFGLSSSALFGVHSWNSGTGETGVVATVLYAGLSRMAWTAALAWITVACSTGCGGLLNSILRWKALVPLSRLTFLVYMVHPLIQHVFYATLREGIQARNCLAVFICFGFIFASYGTALVLSLLLESPFINLGKIIFEKKLLAKKKKKKTRSAKPVGINGELKPSENQLQSEWKSGSLVIGDTPKCNGIAIAQSTNTLNRNSSDCDDFICHL